MPQLLELPLELISAIAEYVSPSPRSLVSFARTCSFVRALLYSTDKLWRHAFSYVPGAENWFCYDIAAAGGSFPYRESGRYLMSIASAQWEAASEITAYNGASLDLYNAVVWRGMLVAMMRDWPPRICVCDGRTRSDVQKLEPPQKAWSRIAVIGGKIIAVGRGLVTVWDAATLRFELRQKFMAEDEFSVNCAGHGRLYICSGYQLYIGTLIFAASGDLVRIDFVSSPLDICSCIKIRAFSTPGYHLALLDAPAAGISIHILDTSNISAPQTLHIIQPPSGLGATGLDFFVSGNLIAISAVDGVSLWSTISGQQLAHIPLSDPPHQLAVFLLGNLLIATDSLLGTRTEVWDWVSHTKLQHIGLKGREVVAFNGDLIIGSGFSGDIWRPK